MKTKNHINRIAKIGLASVAVILTSALAPAIAGNDTDSASNTDNKTRLEVAAAHDRLDAINSAIERSVKFTPSMINEDIEAYEVEAAEDRLENLSLAIAEGLRYEASMVNEEAEAYELALAKERLENLHLSITGQIKFSAPEVIVENTLDYAESMDYTIPSDVVAQRVVLER